MKATLATILLLCNLLGPTTLLPAFASPVGQPIDLFDDVESQLSIYPTDSEETSALDGDKLVYTDFCIATRDNVMGDIRRTTSQLATSVFSMFFRSLERTGLSGALGSPTGQGMASGAGSSQHPGSGGLEPDVKASAADNKVDLEMGEPAEAASVQPAAITRGIFGSVMGALSATRNAVASSVQSTLNSIKSNMGLGTVTLALRDACNKVENYEREMRERFDEATEQLGGVAISSLENLNCVK